MGLPEPDPKSFVTVKALLPTIPYPPLADRPTVTTERLIIRPLVESDVEAYYTLRTDPAVMSWTMTGKPDEDIEYTRRILSFYLPPNDATTFNFAICLKSSPTTFIGAGGCHKRSSELGWPEIGYMLRSQYWGKGYATEFVQAFLQMWARLPRKVEEFKVDPRTVKGKEQEKEQEEMIMAVISVHNAKSLRIVEKCGFEHVITWDGMGREPGEKVDLPTYAWYPGRGKVE